MVSAPIFPVRIPPDLIVRLKAEAAKRGISVADLLLRPWRGDDSGPVAAPPPKPPSPGRGKTVVVAPKRKRVEVVSALRGRFIGYDALTKEPLYRK